MSACVLPQTKASTKFRIPVTFEDADPPADALPVQPIGTKGCSIKNEDATLNSLFNKQEVKRPVALTGTLTEKFDLNN